MDMSWEEQRQQRRVVTVVPVQTVGDLFHANGNTVNLSTSGCAIVGAQVPEKGQHVFLWLQAPKPCTPIKIQLAVVKWSVPGMCGIEFIRLSAAGRTSLQHYLHIIDLSPSLST
jgi:PilZ domain